jgi:hypothetical protein
LVDAAAHVDPIGRASEGRACDEMASPASNTEKAQGALSPRAARAKLEEELGRLDITDEEATPWWWTIVMMILCRSGHWRVRSSTALRFISRP